MKNSGCLKVIKLKAQLSGRARFRLMIRPYGSGKCDAYERHGSVYCGWANLTNLEQFIEQLAVLPIDDDDGVMKIQLYLSANGVIYYRRRSWLSEHATFYRCLRNLGTTEKMRSELGKMGIISNIRSP